MKGGLVKGLREGKSFLKTPHYKDDMEMHSFETSA